MIFQSFFLPPWPEPLSHLHPLSTSSLTSSSPAHSISFKAHVPAFNERLRIVVLALVHHLPLSVSLVKLPRIASNIAVNDKRIPALATGGS